MKDVEVIVLTGDVNADMVENVIGKLDGNDWNSPLEHLIVGIHSPGGEPQAGYAIIDLLKLIAGNATIHTVNLGDTSSAALDIYMIGDHRYGTRMCEFLIHRTYTEPSGKLRSEDLKEEIKGLKQDDMLLFNETLVDTKLPKTMRDKILKGKDVTISHKQARRYNIINTGGLPWESLKPRRKST